MLYMALRERVLLHHTFGFTERGKRKWMNNPHMNNMQMFQFYILISRSSVRCLTSFLKSSFSFKFQAWNKKRSLFLSPQQRQAKRDKTSTKKEWEKF